MMGPQKFCDDMQKGEANHDGSKTSFENSIMEEGMRGIAVTGSKRAASVNVMEVT